MRKLALAIAATWLLAVALIAALAFSGAARAEPPGQCVTAAEAELVQLVNAYRVQNGRPALPATRWLSSTAQWHAWDSETNGHTFVPPCGPHSWSGARPDLWTAVCYTPDHAQAAQMWNKPSQISGGRYIGTGYELIAFAGPPQTPQGALAQWQGSPAHNTVILQQGVWAGVNLTGLGVSIQGATATLWFGDGADPDSPLPACALEMVFADGFEVPA